eukprot:SAG22_NODE_122_length_18920_cov_23.494076_21_plen_86_part_00
MSQAEAQDSIRKKLPLEKAELVDAVLSARGGQSGCECTICLSEYADGDERRVLPCGHRFHLLCIDQWFGTSSKCPLCNKMIDEVD